jgi:predicted aspartyl protease
MPLRHCHPNVRALLCALLVLGATASAPSPLSTSRFEIVEGIPIVDVWINGRGPFSFAVDSGATWTVLSPQLARELKLRARASRNVSGAGPNAVPAAQVQMDSLRVGHAVVNAMQAYVLELPPGLYSPPGHKHVLGLLGETFFHRYVTVIDYETNEIAFFDRATYAAPSRAIALPITLVSGAMVPAVPVSVDADTAVFELDTGSGGWPIATAAFAKSGIDLRYETRRTQTAQGAGGAYALRTICVAHFGLGALAFRDIPMYVQTNDLGITSEGDFQGNLGYQILRHFAVALDFDASKVYLTPNAGADRYVRC